MNVSIRILLALLGVVGLAGLMGCGGSSKSGAPKAENEKSVAKKSGAREPKIPGEDAEDEGATQILIKTPASARQREQSYTQDKELPAGTLRGVCVLRFPKGEKVQRPKPVPWTFRGKQAISQPMKDEAAYYKNIGVQYHAQPSSWAVGGRNFKRRRDGRWGVSGAVLWVDGIKKGTAASLQRPGFMVRHGGFKVQNAGGEGWLFCPIHEKIYVFTYDKYPCQIAVKKIDSGKQIFEGTVRSYDPQGIKKIGAHGMGRSYKRPKPLQSTVFHKLGFYKLYCKRHPWHSGRIFVVDNPYVTVSRSHYDGERVGFFTLGGLPLGKHTIHVWHPLFQPKQKSYEVEIRKNETTELVVEFQPPKL